jgi:hypothetical protein
VINAEFSSVDDFLVYKDHKEHVDLVVRFIKPILKSRVAVQFSV